MVQAPRRSPRRETPMPPWTVHHLDARGMVAPHRPAVERALARVGERLAGVCEPPALDVVVQAVPGGPVIPERGHVGFSPRPGAVFLTLDPGSPHLPASLGEPLERTIAHEVHHALRWDRVGYGRTLGEALVSEGLAGRFVEELFGPPPEPWERAVPRGELASHAQDAAAAFEEAGYGHPEWFFGAGARPRWVGYALGWELVGAYLAAHPEARPSRLAGEPAAAFRPLLAGLADDLPS